MSVSEFRGVAHLAVVCDAEQIIFAEFDRKAKCSISYLSGAIEDAELNQAVVNVLEGTKPADLIIGGKNINEQKSNLSEI